MMKGKSMECLEMPSRDDELPTDGNRDSCARGYLSPEKNGMPNGERRRRREKAEKTKKIRLLTCQHGE